MADTVKPIPAGYHTVTPYLVIRGAVAAMDFYKQAFDATEVMRLSYPDGSLGHAEIQIGDSRVMFADEAPGMGFNSPQQFGGTPVSIMLYVEDVDAVVAQAQAAGATLLRPVQDQFYGDRSGMVQDPFGHAWVITTHKEDVTLEQMQQRFDDLLAQENS